LVWRRDPPWAFFMIDAFLFTPKREAAAEPPDGKITLADVLANGWLELWYQPKIE
jgi:hypothetical protein